MTKPNIFIVSNTAWSIFNFRSSLIRRLIDEKFDVVCIAPEDSTKTDIEGLGARFIHLPISSSISPLVDVITLLRLLVILSYHRPVVALTFTIKPNLYVALVSYLVRCEVIINIAGLGKAFAKKNWMSALASFLYRLALCRAHTVFFQNPSDFEKFMTEGLVEREKSFILPGSGVSLSKFCQRPVPRNERFVFLLFARLLWAKGVQEFVQAARVLQERGFEVDFRIVGFLCADPKIGVTKPVIDEWVSEGVVSYQDAVEDVRQIIIESTCVVLPSYYQEGTPKSLLEALATGRPIITTDSAGCREVVRDGLNGYLCAPRDSADLAEKMVKVLNSPPEQLQAMGDCSRDMAVSKYDEEIVLNRYMSSLGVLM
jgi:glycosyltransferase involved in cell wall biosynthesis